MGLPIIGEIFDGIRWIITEFLDKAPRPLKFILFLLFLVGLVSIIPFFLHLIGYHCTTDLEVAKVSSLRFATNIKIAFLGEDDIINSSSYTPDTITTYFNIPVQACLRTICFNDSKAYYEGSIWCEGLPTVTPFAIDSADYNWIRCVDCSLGYFNKTTIYGQLLQDETKYLCFGDVYAKNESDMNWLQAIMCDPNERCMPPKYYYYEYDTGTYDCNYPEICGLNNTVIIAEVDDLIENSGGELVYDNPDQRSYENAVLLKCDANLRPNITFFGIPVFDYRIWLMIGVIAVLFMFLRGIKRH